MQSIERGAPAFEGQVVGVWVIHLRQDLARVQSHPIHLEPSPGVWKVYGVVPQYVIWSARSGIRTGKRDGIWIAMSVIEDQGGGIYDVFFPTVWRSREIQWMGDIFATVKLFRAEDGGIVFHGRAPRRIVPGIKILIVGRLGAPIDGLRRAGFQENDRYDVDADGLAGSHVNAVVIHDFQADGFDGPDGLVG